MTPARAFAAAVVVALMAGGCANEASTAGAAATTSPTTSKSTPAVCPNGRLFNGDCAGGTAAIPPPASANATTAGPLKFGTSKTAVAGSKQVTVTVFAYRQPTAKSAPKPASPGMEWASIDAQVCLTASGETPIVNDTPWLLIYADGTTAESSNIGYNQFDAPGFPMGDRAVASGRCVRGWITFVAPAGKRATMVEYQWSDGTLLDWATA